MHLANYAGAPAPVVAGVLLIAAVGAVLGAADEGSETFGVPIAVHGIYDIALLVTAAAAS